MLEANKEIYVLRENIIGLVMDVKVHEFVNKDTWHLHLALHVNDTLVGVSSANLGSSRYDYETVVAALQSLKNDYYNAIGSPMRYSEGKLVYLPADQGQGTHRPELTGIKYENNVHASDPTVALSH
ncbi:MAG: hypothetical protein AWU59_1701 [Methanolobus sp. T82-4]|jgi:hypothetical protein|nr:MAG: hypothetical protein AWU59_1701 [Methanolobus sp. T82-4]